MTAIRDAIRDASPSELDELANDQRVTPEQLWHELLDSAGHSAALLHDIAETNRALIGFLDERLPEISARQHRIDRMLAEAPSGYSPTPQVDPKPDLGAEEGRITGKPRSKAKRNG